MNDFDITDWYGIWRISLAARNDRCEKTKAIKQKEKDGLFDFGDT